jgi:transcriptional regulator with XRE-family HTH domain
MRRALRMKCAHRAIITARQLRAARKLIGWSQRVLAEKAGLALSAIKRLECGDVDPLLVTSSSIEKAFARTGVEFIPADGHQGEGVRIKRRR